MIFLNLRYCPSFNFSKPLKRLIAFSKTTLSKSVFGNTITATSVSRFDAQCFRPRKILLALPVSQPATSKGFPFHSPSVNRCPTSPNFSFSRTTILPALTPAIKASCSYFPPTLSKLWPMWVALTPPVVSSNSTLM